jgi:zinc protease
METPKSSVALMYTGEMPYNLRNVIVSQLLSQILDLVYMEKIREDESASYGVQTSVRLHDFPEGRTSIQIFFDTDPEKQDKIISIVKSELERIAVEGPLQTHLNKSLAGILKGREELKQQNDYWLNILDAYYYRNFDAHTEYDNIIISVTVDEIKSFTKKFLDQGNEIEVVMFPASTGDENASQNR